MENFRSDFASDWKMKLFDATGHVIFGVGMWLIFRKEYTPWIILLQWLPDIFLYPRWLHNMITGKYSNLGRLRLMHNMIHSSVGIMFAVFLVIVWPVVGGNMLSHLLWDTYTHRNLTLKYR